MLSRKLLSSPPPVSALARTFASTSLRQRTPGLGDITHDGSEAFTAKQKEFRDGLEAARKKKEQAESQLQSSSMPSKMPISHIPAAWPQTGANTHDNSSSQYDSGQARQAELGDNSSKRSGKLSSLIYGTDEGRQMDREIERSFSQVLARGKYVHSIVFHDVKPDKVDEYTELVGKWYPKMASMPENRVNLVGSWRTEVGDNDTFGKTGCPHDLEMANTDKCISGSINATQVITPHYTASSIILSFQISTRNSRP